MTTKRLIPTCIRVKLIMVFLGFLLTLSAVGADIPLKSTSDQPPRKVIVGTVMQPFWGKHPGLQKRLEQLTVIVDRMQARSQKMYGRGLDLAVLPEIALTGEGERAGEVADWSFPLEGAVQDTFAREARKHNCYIVAPTYLLEDRATKRCSNAAILFDRRGEVVGIYRKVHLVVDTDSGSMEHGSTPGKEEPVFACDFGKLGIQICYDMEFDDGWRELARQGAELVVWPTQSPQTSQPASRAKRNHYYIVSSTWRNNASIFEPTGKIVSQVKWPASEKKVEAGNLIAPEDNVLVQELDLSYAILPWSSTLENGEALKKAFGDKVGYRYYEDEDRGVFWSNDPHMTIRHMLQSLGLIEEQEELQRVEEFYHKAGIPGY
ncbi:MAG TPA: carbon-nitrogen hydrolase family protein [Terriglobia bacterium]|nr:carbon-nitrogen hydrolase family protein [Terriglobia bacterium]